MITPSFGLTATERVLPKLALDFTTAALDSRVTFTRITDATHPATYTNSSGVITLATNNQPRFDYDPVTLVCKGLLIEESRSNLLLNTDALSTQIVVVTAVATTLSFYGTGTIVLSGAASATVTGTGAYPSRKTYIFTPSAGALTLTVTGTVQYAQLETGAFATSYIPTTTTALTRNADVATMTGTNFSSWFNATEGAIETLSLLSRQSATGGTGIFDINDGTVSNTLGMIYRGSGALGCSSTVSGSVTADLFPSSTITANTPAKLTFGYKASNFGAAAQGGSTVTTLSGALPTVNQAWLGYRAAYLNGWLQKVYYWPQRLTNAELQAFSK